MAANFPVNVLSVETCGKDIVTVRLQRPSGYEFRAGQWFRVFLSTRDGIETRTFSHAATGADDWIEFTTRLSPSPFKQALARTGEGASLEISPSGGRLALPPDAERLAFLVGGVGITPVRSLLRDAQQNGRMFSDAALFYGNRDSSCEPYLDELRGMERIGVRLVRVLEHPEPEWTGETGFITSEMVRRNVGADDGRPYVVAGPPIMVDVMSVLLDELGVEPSRRIIEAFGPRKKAEASHTPS